MIRSLRARHRWMIVTMAVLVGVLMVLGILARQSIPKVQKLPSLGAVDGAEASSEAIAVMLPFDGTGLDR